MTKGLRLYREFVTFAKYLNFSKAADALFTSQSNLSKHIKQLEADLELELIARKGNHYQLTDEGSHFLTGIQAIISNHDVLVKECQLIKRHAYRRIVLQDPPHQDKAAAVIFRLASALQTGSQGIDIDFSHEKYKDRTELLLSGKVDVLVEYHCASFDYVQEQYRKKGIRAVILSEEPLLAWGKRSTLEKRNPLSTIRFKELAVMESCDASSPMFPLISEMPLIIGYTPLKFVSPAHSASQFFFSGADNCIFLLPQSCETKEMFASRDDMMFVPLAEPLLTCKGIALLDPNSKHYDIISAALDQITSQI